MSCPTNAFGQPLCHVVSHPDRPGDSFCSTCDKRFTGSTARSEGGFSRPVIDIITGVLALFLAALVHQLGPQMNPPQLPENQPAQQISPTDQHGEALSMSVDANSTVNASHSVSTKFNLAFTNFYKNLPISANLHTLARNVICAIGFNQSGMG
jgi:hypothetical protein